MSYQVFSENEWIYPDSKILSPDNKAVLYSARGADVCFQVLTDAALNGGEKLEIKLEGVECTPTVYQLLTVNVPLNSNIPTGTTLDYDKVKHFVTRKAPFDVYEITMPTDNRVLCKGRAAFFVRLDVPENADTGVYNGKLTLSFAQQKAEIPIELKIYSVRVPELENSNFHMVNWIYYDKLCEQHNVEMNSAEYKKVLNEYLKNETDMRNDYLMIPSGVAVRDGDGKVIDFDFTNAGFVGNIALEHGFKYIMGGFVARFKVWNESDNYLLWDRDISIASTEGYRQLKLYFKRAWQCVVRNGWQEKYMQCLVDEPQFPNSMNYRALSGICRMHMPGVRINDPVETTDIEGAVDVWVVKQAVYEKHIEKYTQLQEMGEEIWLYTCGFPAGYTMNRIIDLPLTASRLPMWMCYKYNAKGFLHWGYHVYPKNEDGTADVCSNKIYPPGNAHVVYNADKMPWYCVRGHLQRLGAQDFELLYILGEKDRAKADMIIEKVCRTFDDYTPSHELFDSVRHELLEALEQ